MTSVYDEEQLRMHSREYPTLSISVMLCSTKKVDPIYSSMTMFCKPIHSVSINLQTVSERAYGLLLAVDTVQELSDILVLD